MGQVRVTTGHVDRDRTVAGEGELILEEVQLEGKKAQPIGEFIKGHAGFVGSELG